ncbi:hypothetical protein AGRA3207_003670 [Actinomadura graeca]|uniref:Uncharacterized protein n=1 Tax=Actinomadura graeca TaxID=2750812 RepID=A0ABX8R7G3_9ACTN|nr:hypothetical protein [Actinomadura graeca]QXJ27044.1 hypothetical protein AGRA3207_003670 [Actinomadura graeca]
MAISEHKISGRRARVGLRVAAARPLTGSPAARYVWGAARLALGWVFAWAFLDKAFGLGHETPVGRHPPRPPVPRPEVAPRIGKGAHPVGALSRRRSAG